MFKRAASCAELWEGEKLAVTVSGRPLLLVHLNSVVYAYENRCAHLGVPMSVGRLEGDTLVCPAHEWKYDAHNGHCLNPLGKKLKRFPVQVRDGEILVDLEGEIE